MSAPSCLSRALGATATATLALVLSCGDDVTPPPGCEEGALACQDGVRNVCQSGKLVADPCPEGRVCLGQGECGACSEAQMICVPGRQRCEAGVFVDDPCPAGETCEESGICRACESGQARCAAGMREVCSAGVWQAEPCGELFPSCVGEGLCRVCSFGELRCTDGVREACAEDGLSFELSPCPATMPTCQGMGECVACEATAVCGPALLAVGTNPGLEPLMYAELSLDIAIGQPFPICGNISLINQPLDLLGDVDGDGASDFVGFAASQLVVAKTHAVGCEGPLTFYSGSIPAAARTRLLADVDADGLDDVVLWDTSVARVLISDGASFAAPAAWLSSNVGVADAHFATDVNGDGRADLVAWSATAVTVALSTGFSFAAPTPWLATPPTPEVASRMGDVNADGMSDLVIWNSADLLVALSTGSAFDAALDWTAVSGNYFGNVKNLMMDIDDDGDSDPVAWGQDFVFVRRSLGNQFSFIELMIAQTPFYGVHLNEPGRLCIQVEDCSMR